MTRRPPAADTDHTLFATMDQLIADAGGDLSQLRGKLTREIMHTAIKLLRDDAGEGEVKLVSRSLKELRYALKVFRPFDATRKISIFGSARTPEDHPTYQACVDFSRDMAESGWMVITGAGDGIMRAGMGGAGTEKSFGVSIRLPFETNANEYIVGDPKLITFRYFFTRKLMFMWMSHAIALFAGGFGTQDEGFEALTLIQTGKAPVVPILLIDAPATGSRPDPGSGHDYWKKWDTYVRESLLEGGYISPEDLNLYFVTDDPAAAAEHVRHFYRNYHSQRFVRDELVLRLHRPLTRAQLGDLNDRFAKLLVTEGRITQQDGPLEEEHGELPQLHRLRFASTKAGYGHLRAMIDRINDLDAGIE
ncbi:MAG: hypothetical protein GVY24_08180 [Planctomycetes bacterium]|jgi:uncharacterized protein (TIGR00730 family)|nr:hypothetical protein [Planctomycetota bacterium]